MGKTKKPVEGRKDQNFMLNWVIRTPRQRIEVKGTPGVDPSVNTHVTIGVSPPPTAGTSSFGGTPIFAQPAPTVASSPETVPTGTPSASGDTTAMSPPLTAVAASRWGDIASSTSQKANFFIDLVSSDEEEEVGVTPSEVGKNMPTSTLAPVPSSSESTTSVPTTTFLPPTMSSSSTSSPSASLIVSAGSTFPGDTPAVAPPLSLPTSSSANKANTAVDIACGNDAIQGSESQDEDEEQMEIPPFVQVVFEIGKLKRISTDRPTELAELDKLLKQYCSRGLADYWVWRKPEKGPFQYMHKEGNRYRTATNTANRMMTRIKSRRIRQGLKPMEQTSKFPQDAAGNIIFTDEELKYINTHPCLHVLFFISQQSERFSEDRSEEEEMLEDLLRLSASELKPNNFFWKWGRKCRRTAYTYFLESDSKFQSLPILLKHRLARNNYNSKEPLFSDYENYMNQITSLRSRQRRYYTYAPCGVIPSDGQDFPTEDAKVNKMWLNNCEIPLFLYLGVYTHVYNYEPDIRRSHFYDQNSVLNQFVENGGMVLSGATHEFPSRQQAADFETFLQVAAFAAQDKGGKLQVMNKKYGKFIPTSQILKAIDAGENWPILTFGDNSNGGDPEDLNFAATCKDLSSKFKSYSTQTTTSSTEPLSVKTSATEKNYTVYVVVAIPKKDAKDKSTPLLQRLVGDNSFEKQYYIGKCQTADLKDGIRSGHFNEDHSPVYQAAQIGDSIIALKTFNGLTEEEAFGLESFLIFYIRAVADNDENVKVLNREYGSIIKTNFLKRAIEYGVGLTPFFSQNCSVNPLDMYNLPTSISSICDITRHF